MFTVKGGQAYMRTKFLTYLLVLVVGGCAGFAFSGGPFPIHALPKWPQPDWARPITGMNCLNDRDYDSLREYTLKMEGVVLKYQTAFEVINSGSP